VAGVVPLGFHAVKSLSLSGVISAAGG